MEIQAQDSGGRFTRGSDIADTGQECCQSTKAEEDGGRLGRHGGKGRNYFTVASADSGSPKAACDREESLESLYEELGKRVVNKKSEKNSDM